MGLRGEWPRQVRFWFLEKLVVSLAILPFRLLVWNWRRQDLPDATVQQIGQQPRVIVAVCHGELPPSLAWADLWALFGRRWLGAADPRLDALPASGAAYTVQEIQEALLEDGTLAAGHPR